MGAEVVDDRAYQIVGNLNRLKNRPVLDAKEATQVVTDPHWMEENEKG